TDRHLIPHTDGSAVHRPPRLLLLACVRPARIGGYSLLVDGQGLYEEIARTEPTMLDVLCAPCSAYFGGASGHLGAVFRQTADGRVAVRLRLDDLARFSPAVAVYLDRLRAMVQRRTLALDLREGDGHLLLQALWP